MATKRGQVLVVDVESTYRDGLPPKSKESEIIEIGLRLVDVPKQLRLSKHLRTNISSW